MTKYVYFTTNVISMLNELNGNKIIFIQLIENTKTIQENSF